uniref:Tyrosine specific protein phosphatases domain-containing protein n=1 Tax=Helicotheca tamesis TaxID=374047 RepID=A0A7S2DZU9_9STRA|mmetsp:Transcript_1080/g.1539  ORF Transcript_1080/g.1539 Transcript_1080/m.1539 type:complete len:265 (+) Transcript_1080:1-795(+)
MARHDDSKGTKHSATNKNPVPSPSSSSFKQKKWWNDSTSTHDPPSPITTTKTTTTFSSILLIRKLPLKALFYTTLTLYILNQKHLLPKPLSRIVSKVLFWPTLPITASKRIGKWWSTNVDDVVIIGGAPFGFLNMPERLYHDHGVRAVINLCDEYKGPTHKYKKLGMEQLWLRTVDHFEPSLDDIKKAVTFIQKNKQQNKKVYVHCRAGHGRSAAIVFAWLLHKDPYTVEPKALNEYFCMQRNVRKTLWKQTNIKQYHAWLKKK